MIDLVIWLIGIAFAIICGWIGARSNYKTNASRLILSTIFSISFVIMALTSIINNPIAMSSTSTLRMIAILLVIAAGVAELAGAVGTVLRNKMDEDKIDYMSAVPLAIFGLIVTYPGNAYRIINWIAGGF